MIEFFNELKENRIAFFVTLLVIGHFCFLIIRSIIGNFIKSGRRKRYEQNLKESDHRIRTALKQMNEIKENMKQELDQDDDNSSRI